MRTVHTRGENRDPRRRIPRTKNKKSVHTVHVIPRTEVGALSVADPDPCRCSRSSTCRCACRPRESSVTLETRRETPHAVSHDPRRARVECRRPRPAPSPPTTSPHATYPTRPQNQLAQAARAWRRPKSALQLRRVRGARGRAPRRVRGYHKLCPSPCPSHEPLVCIF